MTNNIKQERRYRRTEALILNGLTTLLQQKSIKEITVRELADLVDINRSTFYLHYETMSDFHYICYRCDSAVCKNATKRNNERCLTT